MGFISSTSTLNSKEPFLKLTGVSQFFGAYRQHGRQQANECVRYNYIARSRQKSPDLLAMGDHPITNP